MNNSWEDVVNTREFQGLSPEERANARDQYIDQVLGPQMQAMKLQPDKYGKAVQQFKQESEKDLANPTAPTNPIMRGVLKGIKTALPVGSVQELSDVSLRNKPASLKTAGAAADLGLYALPMFGGAGSAKAAMKGVGLAAGGVAGMEAAGVPNHVQAPAAGLLGMIGAHRASPKVMGPVPVGREGGALAEMINESIRPGGIKMPVPGKSAFDAKVAAGALTEGVGGQVEAARSAGIGATNTNPRAVASAMNRGGQSAMRELEVPFIKGAYRPEASAIKGTAQHILSDIDQAGIIGQMGKGEGKKALEAALNVASGFKKTARKAMKATDVHNLDASSLHEAAKQVDESVLALMPKEHADTIRKANKDYAKAVKLEELFNKASSTGSGPDAEFQPRVVNLWWKNMKPKDRALWDASEQAAFDALLAQENPGRARQAVSSVVEKLPTFIQDAMLPDKWKKYIKQDVLTHNPRIRFNRPYMPWMTAQEAQAAGQPAIRAMEDDNGKQRRNER